MIGCQLLVEICQNLEQTKLKKKVIYKTTEKTKIRLCFYKVIKETLILWIGTRIALHNLRASAITIDLNE